jgi:rhamnopyranosyl-N-acetylglucosaminyl-diphospho-decaprenol beta-1,3/1,4-galactofuranosyltransferase
VGDGKSPEITQGIATKVCAVTVAFNDPEELSRLLRSLEGQTDSLSGLVVVDNSENRYKNDNKSRFYRYSRGYEFARYVETERNVGSAGGFSLGMKIAHQKAFDWIWLLDQDGTVESGCLAALLQNAQQADILCPKIIDISNRLPAVHDYRYFCNVWGRITPLKSFAADHEIDFFGSHGTLISRKVLDRIGYYDFANFFVGAEDWDYSVRAVNAGMTIVMVVRAEARHPRLGSRGKTRASLPAGKKKKLREMLGELYFSHVRVLPTDLDYVTSGLASGQDCTQNRALVSLSHAYLHTKRLNAWQFWAALFFSFVLASLRKTMYIKEVKWRKTIKMYHICVKARSRGEWPFRSVEDFCKHLCQ